MCVRLCFLVLLSVINSHSLFSQEIDSAKKYILPEVPIIGSHLSIQNKDLATSIEVFNRTQIVKSNGYRLPEVIKNSNKVFIKSYGSAPLLQTISLNGLGAEHTIVLLDGVKLNSFQNSLIDLSLINLDNVERIEILSNGSSSIFGSDAIGGVVNIITENRVKSDEDKILNLRLILSKGSFNTNRFLIKLSKSLKNLSTAITFNRETSDGNFRYQYDNGINKQIKERENAAYKASDISLNIHYIFDNKTRIKYLSTFANQDKQIPGIETGTQSSLTSQLDKYWNNIMLFERDFSPLLILVNKINYQNNLMNYRIASLTNSFYKNLVYSFSSDFNIKSTVNPSTIGFEFTKASLKSNEIQDGAERNLYAFYATSCINVIEPIKIYPSSRLDIYSDLNEKVFTYSLGINYKPFSDIDFNIKANAGKNFRAPTFNDLYWKESGNKNLKPEKSINTEAGIYYSFESFIKGFVGLSYTFISAKDKIVWIPKRNFIWMPVNIATSVSKNLFLSVSFNKKLSESIDLEVKAGTSLIRSIKTNENFTGDPTKDKYFPYIPLETSNISVFTEFLTFNMNLFFRHYDKRYSDFENKRPLNPYNILDGNLSAKFSVSDLLTELKIEINNITNTNYQVISGYPMPLRNFKFILSINY